MFIVFVTRCEVHIQEKKSTKIVSAKMTLNVNGKHLKGEVESFPFLGNHKVNMCLKLQSTK